MARTKSMDLRIVSELLRNAKRSDRQIAKKLGVSQPTITRRRANVEKELIDGYTTIPKWDKLGYEILAFTFVKTKSILAPAELRKAHRERAKKWLTDQSNVLYAADCIGLGWNAFMVTVHKSYADFDRFIAEHKKVLGPLVSDLGTILVNLEGDNALKPLHLKYLADEIAKVK